MSAIDTLNGKMGRSTVMLATQGDGRLPTSSQNQSPCYTTDWDDVLTIKI